MTPETAMTEIARGLEMALLLGGPPLLTVLGVGVVVGVVQAATQIQEQTIGFVMKAIALVGAFALAGHFLLGRLVSFTVDLFQRIPQLVG